MKKTLIIVMVLFLISSPAFGMNLFPDYGQPNINNNHLNNKNLSINQNNIRNSIDNNISNTNTNLNLNNNSAKAVSGSTSVSGGLQGLNGTGLFIPELIYPSLTELNKK